MNAVIRLDDNGSPYLVVSYKETGEDGENLTAQQDAEKLFFSKLRQNSGSFHVIPGRENLMKFLVVPGGKRPQIDTEKPKVSTVGNFEAVKNAFIAGDVQAIRKNKEEDADRTDGSGAV